MEKDPKKDNLFHYKSANHSDIVLKNLNALRTVSYYVCLSISLTYITLRTVLFEQYNYRYYSRRIIPACFSNVVLNFTAKNYRKRPNKLHLSVSE